MATMVLIWTSKLPSVNNKKNSKASKPSKSYINIIKLQLLIIIKNLKKIYY